MTTASQFVRHMLTGGWATDLGPTTDVAPDQSGKIAVPFLLEAENLVFTLDGGIRKSPGTTKLNSSVMESGGTVKGIFDWWQIGTAGSPTQHRVVHCDTKILRDNGDATFTSLFTGMTADAVPSYAVLEDLLVMANDSSSDVPKSWDGTTAQNLAGTPPNFSFVTQHKNRLFAAGVPAAPSRLYYSALQNGADWVGSGSGEIDVAPDDGDIITGVWSWKDQLLIFKGPYKGSIHRLSGSSPTGADSFSLSGWIKGTSAVWQSTIFNYRDDLGFVSPDGMVRSLNVTAQYGDFREASLSFPIDVEFIQRRVNFSRLRHAWAVNDRANGAVLITVPIDGSTTNNFVMVMDYRFDPPRWSNFIRSAACLAEVVDPAQNNRRIVMAGGYDGYVRKYGAPTRSIDGATAIAMKATYPFLNYGVPQYKKTFLGGSLALAPKNNADITLGWQCDTNSQQTQAIAQAGGDVLGTATANEFTLNTSTLGGASFIESFFQAEEGGEFRAIQFQVLDSTNSSDVELHALTAKIDGGADDAEN